MIILFTKGENIETGIASLKEILNSEELIEKSSSKMLIETGLSYNDLKFLLDIYILEEGRKCGEQVSAISYKDEE